MSGCTSTVTTGRDWRRVERDRIMTLHTDKKSIYCLDAKQCNHVCTVSKKLASNSYRNGATC